MTELTEKTIDTLVPDILAVLKDGVEEIPPSAIDNLSKSIADAVVLSLTERQNKATLRMSNIGTPCNRKLWYAVNEPEEKEELSGEVRMKFLFGHILEDILLFLAELAGHRVEGRQDEQEILGIKGHRDAVIDGVLVDVKSASTYSFKKFEEGKLAEDDAFGYIDQIQSYLHCAQDDPVVTDKERCAFLVIDKTLGNICLDVHKKTSFPMEKIVEYKKDMVARPEPPSRGFDPVPEGKSGNMKLPTVCSYCDFKKRCHPNVRTFLYASKPVFLTKVVREPNVPELSG